MAQFQLYPNPRTSRSRVPYLLDVQSDIVSIGMRWIVPMVLESSFGPRMTRINPVYSVDGCNVVMSTADMAGVPVHELGQPMADLSAHRREILGAIDFMLNGY